MHEGKKIEKSLNQHEHDCCWLATVVAMVIAVVAVAIVVAVVAVAVVAADVAVVALLV